MLRLLVRRGTVCVPVSRKGSELSRRLQRWGLILVLWLAATVIVCAQQSAGLHVGKRADAVQVTPGERLRLVITLANEGPDALAGLVVRDVTPEGTVFFGAAAPRDWMITTPQQGQVGEVTWRSTAPLDSGASVELEMLVTVQAENGSLVSPGCTVEADTWSGPLTGPAVTVIVVAPTATPTPDRGWASSLPFPWLLAGGLAILVGVAVVLLLSLRRRAS
jgi:uncharacterized repeat protein (TIGR01451 family)